MEYHLVTSFVLENSEEKVIKRKGNITEGTGVIVCKPLVRKKSHFYPKQGCIYKKIGTFIEDCIWKWCTFCLFYFLLNSHSSTKINSFQPI